MPRFPRVLSGLALMLALPLSGCLDTGPDVVCVDVDRVLSQSRAAQQANEHLAKVQAILQNGLDVYQEELKKSPEEKREQELRQGLAVLQRQLALQHGQALTQFLLAFFFRAFLQFFLIDIQTVLQDGLHFGQVFVGLLRGPGLAEDTVHIHADHVRAGIQATGQGQGQHKGETGQNTGKTGHDVSL